jgi:hypothetical protein
MKTTVATRAHVSAAGEGEKGARGFPLLDWAEKRKIGLRARLQGSESFPFSFLNQFSKGIFKRDLNSFAFGTKTRQYIRTNAAA